jgi:hypothetical protein
MTLEMIVVIWPDKKTPHRRRQVSRLEQRVEEAAA